MSLNAFETAVITVFSIVLLIFVIVIAATVVAVTVAFSLILCGVLCGFIGFVKGSVFKLKWKRKKPTTAKSANVTDSEEEKEESNIEEGQECVVCHVRRKTTCSSKCGHKCYCNICARKPISKKYLCAICREPYDPYENLVRVYD